MKKRIQFICLYMLLVITSNLWALPVTNGLVIYLDAGTITGVADGGAISTWSDISGLGNDATQGTSANRPVYDAANLLFNGFPTVHFDGSNDYLSLPSGAGCPINVGSFTVFVVGTSDVLGVSQYFCSAQGTSGNDRLRIAIDSAIDGAPFHWRIGDTGWPGSMNATSDTARHIFGASSGGGTAEGVIDGVSIGTAANSSSDVPSNFGLGAANLASPHSFLNGDIAEFIVYNRTLSPAEYAQVNDFLETKYTYSDSTPPAAPTGLVATAGGNSVSLDWDDNTEFDLHSYNVYRDTTSGGPYTQIASDIPASSYVDSTGVNGTTYYYVVTAVDTSSNESGNSNEASATPQVPIRYMENLDRGVVAVRNGSNAFISWRLLGLDPSGIEFNLYRSANAGAWTKLNDSPLTGGCNYTDSTVNLSVANAYRINPVINSVEQASDGQWTLPANSEDGPLFRIPLSDAPANRRAEKIWVGDLNGDGVYEYIICWTGTITGQTQKLQAYKVDGTFLWEADFGLNSVDPDNIYPNAAAISVGQWDGVTVYDLDSDGYAEVIVKSANGVTFGDGVTLNYGDNLTQFISVLDGMTGAEKARIELPNPWKNDNNYPLGTLFGIGYLDGVRPSLVIHAKNRTGGSGTPFNTINSAWDYRGGVISQRWSIQWDGNIAPQASHSMRIVDIDGDGRDELACGVFAVDDNGTLFYDLGDVGVVHGDRFQIGDLDPSRPGQEMYMVQQDNPSGLHEFFADAATGELLWTISGALGDVGRGSATDLDPTYPGAECWAFEGIHSADGTLVSPNYPWPNLVIWWNGDLFGDNLDKDVIDKWNYSIQSSSRMVTCYHWGTSSNSRSISQFQGDIIGDWREEIVFDSPTHDQLLVFTTSSTTTHRLYTLAHNPAYRNCMTTQGYRQQHIPDYFLGDGMSTPPTPNIIIVGSPVFTTNLISNNEGVEMNNYTMGNSLAMYVYDPSGIQTVTFSKDSGPSWLVVAADGTLSGIPVDLDVGPNEFTVRVTDDWGLSDTATMTIQVTNTYSGTQGLPDLAGLAAQWLSTDCVDVPACDGADLDGDDDVTLSDFSVLAYNWLADESLQLHLPFDETSGDVAYDSSIYWRDGSLLNSPSWDTGYVGGALNFDGLDDYVEITGYNGIGGAQARTTSAWIKTKTGGDILGWGNKLGLGTKWCFCVVPTGHLAIQVQGYVQTTSATVNDENWHHVAVVLPEKSAPVINDLELYIDGDRITDVTSAAGTELITTGVDNTVKVGVFEYQGTGLDYFDGLIDDVRIYERALTQQEITSIAHP